MATIRLPTEMVKTRTLPTQVAAHLTRRILDGRFEEGGVPSELDIAQEFGVSRIVARETLKILESLDMLQIAQGRRVTVRPPAEWDYLSPLLIEWLPTAEVGRVLAELYEMRLLLEPELVASAATQLNEETLRRLDEQLERMARLQDEPDKYLVVDQEFHMEICHAGHNRILDRIMYSSRWLLTASRQVTNDLPGSLQAATSDHRRIYDALVVQDPQKAREAMRLHLRSHGDVWARDPGGPGAT